MGYRCYVGFSSTDKRYFDLMKAWKANKNQEFDFINCQLDTAINSENEDYIKRKCRECIKTSSTFIQIIGNDTKHKHKYVRWEAEVALEKNCRIICVNINGARQKDSLCPPILNNKGAIFVPFNQAIIQYAIDNFQQKNDDNWSYKDSLYKELGL